MQVADVSLEGPKPRTTAWTRVGHAIRDDRITQFFVIAVVTSLLVLVFVSQVWPQTFEAELPKAVFQLGVLAVGGALIGMAVKVVEDDRATRERKAEQAVERRREDFEYLMSIHSNVTNAYNSIKTVHRRLNAANVKPPKLDRGQTELLKRQLEVLEDAQLSLEGQMRVMRVRHAAFRKADGTSVFIALTYCLRQMEGYINDVLKDTREHPSTMVRLTRFLGSYNDDGGIRQGDCEVHSPKTKVTDWKESGAEPGNGPSAHLRHIEGIVAEALPDGSRIPADFPVV